MKPKTLQPGLYHLEEATSRGEQLFFWLERRSGQAALDARDRKVRCGLQITFDQSKGWFRLLDMIVINHVPTVIHHAREKQMSCPKLRVKVQHNLTSNASLELPIRKIQHRGLLDKRLNFLFKGLMGRIMRDVVVPVVHVSELDDKRVGCAML